MKSSKRFRQIYLEITNRCNLNCPFCDPTSRTPQSLSLEQVISLAPQIAKLTDQVYLHLKGEPLIHPQLLAIIKVFESYQVTIKITTNATFLDKLLEIIKNTNNIKRINLSLQALVNFNHDQQINYLQQVKEFIDQVIELDRVDLTLRLWQEDQMLYQLITTFVKKNYDFIPQGSKSKIINHLYFSLEQPFIWPSLNNELNPLKSKCLGGITHIGILANLDVVICCLDHDNRSQIGNLNDTDLETLVASDRFQAIVSGNAQGNFQLEICKRCHYRNRFVKILK